ncbi:ABC transporter permease [Streptomyces sp. NPDC005805]|uniref:ABC transporter permease n=1 Tax=Streptomyces sp. NPDC005805 TaxID=3157068 RepID=UPI0033D1BA5F
MSAPAAPATAGPAATPVRRGLRGPAWVVVRQHRTVLTAAAVVLTLAWVTAVGLRVWYEATPPDDFERNAFARTTVRGTITAVVGWATLSGTLLPPVVAAVVAGPFIARELESGTYRLAWSQSVSPVRWFTVKLAVPAIAVAVLTAVATGAFRLLWSPVSGDAPHTWTSREVFLVLGPTVTAHGLLAVAVGALAGLLVRRTLVAMSVAALTTGAVLAVLASRWTDLWPVLSGTRPVADAYPLPNGLLVTDSGLLTASGQRLPETTCFPDRLACLAEHEVTGRWFEYHPGSHLWPLQLVETAVVLALAAALAYTALRVFRRRHG